MSASSPARPVAPRAAVRPHVFEEHGRRRVDDYYWLRDDSRSSPEVLGYLEAENAFTRAVLAPTEPLQRRVFDELTSRLAPDDDSVPYRRHGFWYSRRFEGGREYERIVRRADRPDALEETVLDLEERARGHEFFALGGWDVSPDGRRLAWTEDTVSRRLYTLRVRDLATGEPSSEEIPKCAAEVVWANDNATLFYIEKDPVTLLGFRVRRHRIGTDSALDPVVWEETDLSFYTSLRRSKSGRFLQIVSESTVASEVRLLDASRPEEPPRLFLPRERDHEYAVEDLGEFFVVRTNWRAQNFRLMLAPAPSTADRSTWRELSPHRSDVFVDDFEAFPGWIAIAERSDGQRQIRLLSTDGATERHLEFDEPDATAWLTYQSEQATTKLRYAVTSLRTPESTFEIDLVTGERKLLKQQAVLGGFDSSRYATQRIWVTARDGVLVPVSLLHRREVTADGTAPLLIEAYGAYGYSSDPHFDSDLFSLVDRGFVYAIAHVRGGQEMGRGWYEEGKLLHKKNTFHDFIDVTEALVARKCGAPDRVFALGGSAGGLLMGVIATTRPDLYRGVVAAVPFVDIVTTMLDESIPLTANEFDEWGDPRVRESFEYMLSYSPYDQAKPQAYPNLLVTTGLWDSQVQYFEPAKWVAKLRSVKTDDHWLFLQTNMEAGHGGKSGRFARRKDTALHYGFVLALAGIQE